MKSSLRFVRSIQCSLIFAAFAATQPVMALAQTPESASQSRPITLPKQGAVQALQSLTEQTGFNVVYDPAILIGVQTSPVNGSMTPRAALGQMFAGTGIDVVDDAQGGASLRVATKANQPSRDEGIASVVVTSRKFKERLLDVPIAVSVFTNEELSRRGAQSISDALQAVPGVSAYDAGSGISKVSIRGISTSLGGNENGYYLDDLPFTGVTVPISPDVRAWDLERVEVLRGPQGTLFGEGSMGGTIRTLTNNARLNQFSFAGEAGLSRTQGGGNNHTVKGMINVPVINDMLALRVAATDDNYKGWIDDPATGRTDINPVHTKTARLRANFKPMDELTINASYWQYRSTIPYGNSETDEGTASHGFTSNTAPEYTLRGISGTYDFDRFNVFYGYAKNAYNLPSIGQFGGGAFIASIGIDVETHELRLSSTEQKPWRWTAGLYRRTANRFDNVSIAAFGINQTSATDSTATSIFADVTYTFPQFPLEASLGMRHFRDRIRGADTNIGVASPVTNNRFSSNNPRVSLAYRPNENQQIYASASKGFRSGQNQVTGFETLAGQYGIVLPSSLKPDSIWTYELGTKLSALDRRLNMEFAVYHSDWKDFAVRLPIANTGFNGLISSQGTKTDGLDASFAYAMTKSFTATLNAGYVDAKYVGAVPGTGIVDGARVDDVPRLTVSASGEYRFPALAGWEGRLRADFQHAAAHPSTTFPTQQASGDPIDTVNARLAFSKGPWTVTAYGENLSNERGSIGLRTITYLSATETDVAGPRLRPRTFGLELRYAMGK